MQTKFQWSRKPQLAFGSAVLALLVVGAVSYRCMVESSESDLKVRRTYEVLEKLQGLLAAMQAVESSARGYLLAGDESFLEAYRASRAKTEKAQALVRSLTADNPGQQQRLDALATLAAQQFQLAEKVLGLRQTKALQASAAAIQEGSSTQNADDFQSMVGRMQNEELRLLPLR
jgi:methyl-accepting chemotaxis protein